MRINRNRRRSARPVFSSVNSSRRRAMARRRMLNSKRRNLIYDTEQERWGENPQLLIPLDYDEKVCYNYDTNPYRTDWGNNHSTCSPSCYILPYWFGRYYGLIEE